MKNFLPACGIVAVMSAVLIVDSVYGAHFEPYVSYQSGPRAFVEVPDVQDSQVPEGIEIAFLQDATVEEVSAAGDEGQVNIASGTGEGSVLGVSRTIEEVAAAMEDADGDVVVPEEIAEPDIASVPSSGSDNTPTTPPVTPGEDRDAFDDDDDDDDDGDVAGANRPRPTDPDDDDDVNYSIKIGRIIVDDLDYEYVRVYFSIDGLTDTQSLMSAQLYAGDRVLASLEYTDENGEMYYYVLRTDLAGVTELTARVGILDMTDPTGPTTSSQSQDFPVSVPQKSVPNLHVDYYSHSFNNVTTARDYFSVYVKGNYQEITSATLYLWDRKIEGVFLRYDRYTGAPIYRFDLPAGMDLYHGMPIEFFIEGTVLDSDGVEVARTGRLSDIVEIYKDNENPQSGIGKPMPDDMAALLDENGHYTGTYYDVDDNVVDAPDYGTGSDTTVPADDDDDNDDDDLDVIGDDDDDDGIIGGDDDGDASGASRRSTDSDDDDDIVPTDDDDDTTPPDDTTPSDDTTPPDDAPPADDGDDALPADSDPPADDE